jgi:hypothetical protein
MALKWVLCVSRMVAGSVLVISEGKSLFVWRRGSAAALGEETASTHPGARALTLILKGRKRVARQVVRCTTADLETW